MNFFNNSNIHHLIRVLDQIGTKKLAGKTLVIQMDNTWQENKNQMMFAFLGSLVESGVVKDVRLNFLPVGHTHEDIDQMFSCFAC